MFTKIKEKETVVDIRDCLTCPETGFEEIKNGVSDYCKFCARWEKNLHKNFNKNKRTRNN